MVWMRRWLLGVQTGVLTGRSNKGRGVDGTRFRGYEEPTVVGAARRGARLLLPQWPVVRAVSFTATWPWGRQWYGAQRGSLAGGG